MEAVTDLMSPSPEADIFQRTAAGPRMDPEAKDALIGLPKLPCPGKDPTAVDPNGEVKGHTVLERQQFGALLRRSIEGNRWLGGELLCDSSLRE
jgi:hypothetical protein